MIPEQATLFEPPTSRKTPHPWVQRLVDNDRLSAQSQTTYAAWWGQFIDWLTRHRLDLASVDEHQVEAFLEEGARSYNTRIRYFRLLQRVFEMAVQMGDRRDSPCSERLVQRYFKEEEPVPTKAVPPDTVPRALARAGSARSWKEQRDWTLVALSAECGLRRSDVVGLKWKALLLHTPRPRLTLDAVGNQPARDLDLSPGLAAVLGAWHAASPGLKGAERPVFPSTRQGAAMDPATCHRAVTRCLRELGLAPETSKERDAEPGRPGRKSQGGLNVLRAGLALRQKLEGEQDLEQLRERLGHVQLASTKTLVDKVESADGSDSQLNEVEGRRETAPSLAAVPSKEARPRNPRARRPTP